MGSRRRGRGAAGCLKAHSGTVTEDWKAEGHHLKKISTWTTTRTEEREKKEGREKRARGP